MCSTKFPNLWNALTAEFHPNDVKIHPRGYRYTTVRTVMNRLDDVLGPENWWDDYTPTDSGAICRLTIRLPDGQLLTKVDIGGDATTLKDLGDADKGGFSDGLKRTAFKFGVGRYLYGDGQVVHRPAAPAPTPATARTTPPCEGVAGGAGPVATAKPTELVPARPTEPPRPGSQDAQGRGGKLVYGQSSVPAWPPGKTPKTGEDLHHYAISNTIDPGLYNWIANTHNPQGYPAKLVDWSPAEVRRALASIREHLITVKQARDRMKRTA